MSFNRIFCGLVVFVLFSVSAISALALDRLTVTDENGKPVNSYRWVLYAGTAQDSPIGVGTNRNLSTLYSKVDSGKSYTVSVVTSQRGPNGYASGEAVISPGQSAVQVQISAKHKKQ